MQIDETIGWNINPFGGTWSITTVDGDIIADDIPHGDIAHYIAEMHNTKVRSSKNFRIMVLETSHRDDGSTDKQCGATAHPYRCVYGAGHTGQHVTYGTTTTYVFD